MTSVVHNLPERFGNVIARNTYQAIILFFNVPAIVRRSLIHSLCPRL